MFKQSQTSQTMTETFICQGEFVHFTNGGCRELYLAWARCAETLQLEDLATTLINQTNLGPGCVADGIDEAYLSDDFSTQATKAQLLAVMERLIAEIQSNGAIAQAMDVRWDAQLQADWVEKLQKLRNALVVQV